MAVMERETNHLMYAGLQEGMNAGTGAPGVEEPHVPLRVLLVDDTSDDEALALRAMRQSDLPLLVRVAQDGEHALAALGLVGDQPLWVPDLIVCDLKMPKLNGDEVLSRVRALEHLNQVPFVIFSSSDETEDANRCIRLGADAYVVKPVDFACYVHTVRVTVLSHLAPLLRSAKRKQPPAV